VVTTDSRHNLPVYPNLARDVTRDGVNQLWRADITYIRLRNEFVYLAVVLDAYSRRVIGWALGRTLEAGLAVSALAMQIARPPLIPAGESALGLRPRSTLSSAQVFPEWITTTSPWNDLSTNGDNPLTRCLTPGVQFTASAVCPSSSSSLSSSFWRLCNDVSFESTDPRE
jgi:hypothetical protein